eukprot:TRINITY_DN6563_c0_g1_i1.p1 TRINITY_DN6563_c0_g1~~TRINITY_DN6563_c0_g1_i1.p1  ORF type:complete len:256 (+),score=54.61 TRINITY_DN6563_c0_g1_i1:107-874(+)
MTLLPRNSLQWRLFFFVMVGSATAAMAHASDPCQPAVKSDMVLLQTASFHSSRSYIQQENATWNPSNHDSRQFASAKAAAAMKLWMLQQCRRVIEGTKHLHSMKKLGVSDIVSLVVLILVIILVIYFLWGGRVQDLRENPIGALRNAMGGAAQDARDKANAAATTAMSSAAKEEFRRQQEEAKSGLNSWWQSKDSFATQASAGTRDAQVQGAAVASQGMAGAYGAQSFAQARLNQMKGQYDTRFPDRPEKEGGCC